jgi:MFS family permease
MDAVNSQPNARRLFAASCVALALTAMSFALRGDAAAHWAQQFSLSQEQVGWVNGAAFWGFALAILFGGPLCDVLGLKRIVGIAFVGHLVGIAATILAWNFVSLFTATLVFGIANGSVEAACNPLVAALYPANKTTRLNNFHVWFPGGIVIGGLLSYGLGRVGFDWRAGFVCLLVPLVVYGVLFGTQVLPSTERVSLGVSGRAMWRACLRPLFLLMVACMLLTAATELGPTGWIPAILSNAGVSGILVLVWITGLMAVGRAFAGPFVHRMSALGMLVASSVLSAIGLWMMSRGVAIYGAATVFALGVCFFWPTMLGFVNENLPETGAVGLAIMGAAGVLSTATVLPIIGRIYDVGIASGMTPAAAGLAALGRVVVLPVILAVVFGTMLLVRGRGRGQEDLISTRENPAVADIPIA